jgi:hypothetical protein
MLHYNCSYERNSVMRKCVKQRLTASLPRLYYVTCINHREYRYIGLLFNCPRWSSGYRVRFQVLMAASMKLRIFLDILPCS